MKRLIVAWLIRLRVLARPEEDEYLSWADVYLDQLAAEEKAAREARRAA